MGKIRPRREMPPATDHDRSMTFHTIDTHGHVAAPYADALVVVEPDFQRQRAADAAAIGRTSLGVNAKNAVMVGHELVSVEARLAWMDHAGVDLQIVAPLPWQHPWADHSLAARFAEETNAAVVAHCAVAPDRLVGVGAVSLQHPDLAVGQLDEVRSAGLRGVQISTTARPGTELDSPVLEEFWAAAASAGLVVLIHPWGCSLSERLADYYLFNTVGNPTETTLALSRLIFGGVLERHPDLRVWAPHGGGYLGAYLGRSDHAWHNRPDARTTSAPPSALFRRLWVDSLVYSSAQLRHLVETIGTDRVVLGSDYPFDMGVRDPVERLVAAGLPDDAVASIRGRNAASLFDLEGA
jgi:predicted TIM-barrel fold metal-dependent hydrolase